MDREAWRAAVHGVTKSQTRLSDWTELNWSTFHKGGRARASRLGQLRAAKTPSPSLGLSPLILLYLLFGVAEVWKRKWQPTPVFLPKNPVDRGAWWAAVHGVAWSRTRLKRLSMHACLGEGNGSPLRCSCPENPRDGGAWQAAVYGVAQSRTRLKRLSSKQQQAVLLQNCCKAIWKFLWGSQEGRTSWWCIFHQEGNYFWMRTTSKDITGSAGNCLPLPYADPLN